MKIFLLIGQSNMAGRGRITDVPLIEDNRIFKIVCGRFLKMWEPLNQDREYSGIGPGASFAQEYAVYYNEPIGLVPCAFGGTALEAWMPGSVLFDNAVNNTRLALRSGELEGILWHQGENDCRNDDWINNYAQRLRSMVLELYRQINIHDVPFIAGELGDLPYEQFPEGKANYAKINAQLCAFAKSDKRFHLVSAQGLTANEGDTVHFNSKSQREFGRRYFEVYKQQRG